MAFIVWFFFIFEPYCSRCIVMILVLANVYATICVRLMFVFIFFSPLVISVVKVFFLVKTHFWFVVSLSRFLSLIIVVEILLQKFLILECVIYVLTENRYSSRMVIRTYDTIITSLSLSVLVLICRTLPSSATVFL